MSISAELYAPSFNRLQNISASGTMRAVGEFVDLKSVLKERARKKGAVVFGVVSIEDANALPSVKIEWTINRWTKRLRDSMPEARSVVVFGILSTDDADEIEIRRSDGRLDYPGYMPISIIMRDLMRVLRDYGFRARAPSVYASYKRIAQLAGMGSYGKNALIIHPKYGPWLRFGAVLTDAPLLPDRPFEGDLCGKCERCLTACPADALEPYVVNPNRCLVGVATAPRARPELKRLLPEHSPVLTPQSRVMCTACQLACRYTTAERRRNVFSPASTRASKSRGKKKPSRPSERSPRRQRRSRKGTSR
ncbi:MAG: epoxyqueuosine reductase [Candidatus Thermoplasmatota archaeon]|nr:epoxyqueuosine reductase [Candidatus Thermoplasmatota archaeon]